MLRQRAARHIDHHRGLRDAPAHFCELRRADERRQHQVGAGFGIERKARDGVIEVLRNPEGIGARDDEEIGILARVDGSTDARRGLVRGAQLLRDAGMLAEAVVLDMDRRNAGLFEGLHRAPDVGGIMKAAFRIGDHRNLHCIFNRGDPFPPGVAAVSLLAGAGMERDGIQSAILCQLRQFDEAIWEFGQLLLGQPSRFAGMRLPAGKAT